MRSLAGQSAAFLQPAVPFVIHALASGLAFTAGLWGTQFAGIACRVSCANPILGPSMGMVGIGVSSAMAGQASLRCQHYFRTGQHPFSGQPAALLRRHDLLLDACMGVILYKLMGGRFRNLMPSDLFKPGSLARGSLPAPGAQYASEMFRDELKILMRRDGCHHCGKTKGKTIGDHIPPNKLAHGSRKEVQSQLKKALGVASRKRPVAKGAGKGSKWWPVPAIKQKLGLTPPPKVAQRYFPQCLTCCQKQSAAVKANKRTLVAHNGGARPWYYAGVLIGMRYFHSPAGGSAMLLNDYQNVRRHVQGSFSEDDAEDSDVPWSNPRSNNRNSRKSSSDRWSIQAAERHR